MILASSYVSAQERETTKIKHPDSFWGNRCRSYLKTVKELPKEERYSVYSDKGIIFITAPSSSFFDEIYDKAKDGIAIDIIKSDQYNCEENINLSDEWPNRGYLMPTLFKKDIQKKVSSNALGATVLEYGYLPSFFNPEEIEFNLLIIQKKALCDYSIISKLDYKSWALLNMGLYWGTLSNITDSKLKLLSKKIKFEILFDKNESYFSPSDIKPLYDTLNLSSFDIKEITITSYTSIEGSKERNTQLQKERSESLVNALQEYQNEKIIANMISKENWSQFSKDLTGTKFEFLKKYSKEKINRVVTRDKNLSKALEPILKNQQKGLIELRLERKITSYENDPVQLKELFGHVLYQHEVEQALFLQQLIFDKIRNNEISENFFDQIEVPKSSEFGPLFNNLILFYSERNKIESLEALRQFENLTIQIPNNPKIKYNRVVLLIQLWTRGETEKINRSYISKLIKSLEGTQIKNSLIKRLWINYNIILSQYLEYEKDYKRKDRWVKELYHQYKSADFSNGELLSLAKYIAFYSHFKSAEGMLYVRIRGGNYSEDILFYYLKLTVGNPKKHSKSTYSSLIEKAIDLNKIRYCNLFLPKPQGGLTFQLKEYPILKKTYCNFCNGLPNSNFF